MILLFGNDLRVPCSPAHKSSEAIEAAWPMQSVLTGLRMYCSDSKSCRQVRSHSNTSSNTTESSAGCDCIATPEATPKRLHLHGVINSQASSDYSTTRIDIHGYLQWSPSLI